LALQAAASLRSVVPPTEKTTTREMMPRIATTMTSTSVKPN
jgi:hypothetical protein